MAHSTEATMNTLQMPSSKTSTRTPPTAKPNSHPKIWTNWKTPISLPRVPSGA